MRTARIGWPNAKAKPIRQAIVRSAGKQTESGKILPDAVLLSRLNRRGYENNEIAGMTIQRLCPLSRAI